MMVILWKLLRVEMTWNSKSWTLGKKQLFMLNSKLNFYCFQEIHDQFNWDDRSKICWCKKCYKIK